MERTGRKYQKDEHLVMRLASFQNVAPPKIRVFLTGRWRLLRKEATHDGEPDSGVPTQTQQDPPAG